VFSYRLSKAFNEGDMLIVISSSGNSPNIVKAVKTAKERGGFVVTVTGKSPDNKCRLMGDLNFHVALDTYGLVEAAHSVLLHCWLDMFLDKYKGGRH
jgi:D-sedoheptulose 7-phosphate isomerase